ncbi:uncharacterized protein LOC142332815 [Lycorma delicatula]|uniref:uncharacterized protein LOC142332815 n=1 Tax=Lycorma delicatula TaxID=130591 RepID=UPI003F50EC3A
MIGPTIQRDLQAILLSFRTHAYVFTADIKQMYHRILIDESQQDFQLIVWRNDVSNKIDTYRLKTVTYSTASVPFLAIPCLIQLAEEGKDLYPKASKSIRRDFYVDDVLTGGDSVDELIEIQSKLIDLLNSGGFQLHKWCSNHPSILKNVPKEHLELGFVIEDSESKAIKTLGIYWQPTTDTFRFKVNLQDPPNVVTKRVILSDISRLFDPLGNISPIIITAKLLI